MPKDNKPATITERTFALTSEYKSINRLMVSNIKQAMFNDSPNHKFCKKVAGITTALTIFMVPLNIAVNFSVFTAVFYLAYQKTLQQLIAKRIINIASNASLNKSSLTLFNTSISTISGYLLTDKVTPYTAAGGVGVVNYIGDRAIRYKCGLVV